jgi:hypothetical protein
MLLLRLGLGGLGLVIVVDLLQCPRSAHGSGEGLLPTFFRRNRGDLEVEQWTGHSRRRAF